MLSAYFTIFVLKKFPTAVLITEAFNIKINIAPAPKKNEKKIENNKTLRLFASILPNNAVLLIVPEVIIPPNILLFMFFIVLIWVLKTEPIIVSGKKIY